MKNKGEPALDIWNVIMKQYHMEEEDWKMRMNVHEDNTTAITAVRTNKNQTMKTLERNHGVVLGWMHERVKEGNYNLIHTRSEDMSADLFTKAFTQKVIWTKLRKLVNILL